MGVAPTHSVPAVRMTGVRVGVDRAQTPSNAGNTRQGPREALEADCVGGCDGGSQTGKDWSANLSAQGQGQVGGARGTWEEVQEGAHQGRDPGSEGSERDPAPGPPPQGRTTSWEGTADRESPLGLISEAKPKAGTQA